LCIGSGMEGTLRHDANKNKRNNKKKTLINFIIILGNNLN